jgi:transposase
LDEAEVHLQGHIEMSGKEVRRLEVLRQVADGVITQRQAAEKLGLCDRQVRRLLRRYERQGAAGLVSRKRGKPSNRRIHQAVKDAILWEVKARYADFGPTLAAEYLAGDGYKVSKETLRRWMTEAGLWQPVSGRRGRVHPPRPRRARQGELIQIDGSLHAWFEDRGKRCALIAFIDDATSRVMLARFVPVESTQAYLALLEEYVSLDERPVAFYSDRHSIFTQHDLEDAEPTQFERATRALGMATLQALTPQAKGRVERLFKTLQDRLVKAMRLAGISDIETANAWLPEYSAQHNARFAVKAQDTENAHLPFAGSSEELARLCAIHHRRRLSKDLVISFRRRRYIVQTGGAPRYALRGQQIDVITYRDGRIELMHGKERLPFKVFDPAQDVPAPVDDKSLTARVDALVKARRWSDKSRPAPHHPWRRYPAPSPSADSQPVNP